MNQRLHANSDKKVPPSFRYFSVAPMMKWTDRHCRFFFRILSKKALLYTEMITSNALLNGNRKQLLSYDSTEHPLSLQLGGSNPGHLAKCALFAEQYGYDEVNLNIGCPSIRVQNNNIGASLMREPHLVSDCIKAMQDNVSIPITVKHRIGLKGHDSYANLSDFVGIINKAGCDTFIIHARIAVLEGLSPKKNREVPPLRYDVVSRLKKDFPNINVIINGGINTIGECVNHLKSFNGVMMGREIYHNPYLLSKVDQTIFGDNTTPISRNKVLDSLYPYIRKHLDSGGSAHHITRHILNLNKGMSSAKKFRKLLSEDIRVSKDPIEVFLQAAKLIS